MAFRGLLEKTGPDRKKVLVGYLSDSERKKAEGAFVPVADPFSFDFSIEDRIKVIHYSWIAPFVRPFAEADQRSLLSVLAPAQAEKLKLYFKISRGLKKLGFHPKRFLQRLIYDWLISTQKEFVPVEYLPAHPLNAILELKKSSIQHLVDFLGLHDLALELKKMVTAKQIKKIQEALSKPHREYLKKVCKSKEPISFARFNLERWDGDETKLKQILHQRGFNRLSKALFGCHPSLMWHITRRLDTGRTKIMRKFFTDMNNEKAQEALKKQVVSLILLIREHYE